MCLSTLGPIRTDLTSHDLSSDTKFSPSQSCVMQTHVHGVVNKITASVPIFFHSNLFETSWIGAEKFASAIQRGADKFLPLFKWRWQIFMHSAHSKPLRLALTNFSGSFRKKLCQRHTNLQGVYFTIAFYNIFENPLMPIFFHCPISAEKFCSANWRGFKQLRREKIGTGALFSLITLCTNICRL